MRQMADVKTSKRFVRLRETHQGMLSAWKLSLDAPAILANAFPTLSSSGHKPVVAALQSLYEQFWEQLQVNVMVRPLIWAVPPLQYTVLSSQAEFEKISEEASVVDRFVALEQLMADHDAGVVPL